MKRSTILIGLGSLNLIHEKYLEDSVEKEFTENDIS